MKVHLELADRINRSAPSMTARAGDPVIPVRALRTFGHSTPRARQVRRMAIVHSMAQGKVHQKVRRRSNEEGGLFATPDIQAVGGARSEKVKQEPEERGSDKVVSRLRGSWSG